MAYTFTDKPRMCPSFQELWQRYRNLMGGHYASGLFLVAVMLTAVFLLIGTGLDNQRGNIARVKLAENVVRLTEAARGEILTLSLTTNPDLNRKARSNLLETLTKIGDAHSILVSGDRILPTKDLWYITAPGELSDELEQIYFGTTAMDEQLQQFINGARSLASRSNIHFDDERVSQVLNLIDRILPELERAATFVEKESAAEFDQAVTTFSTLYVVMLLGLLAVAQMVLKPLVNRLENTIGELQQEKDFTSAVLNTSQALITVTDQQGEIHLINEYTQEESGWAKEELDGTNFFDHFIPEEERDTFKDNLRQLMEGRLLESELETHFLLRTGESLAVVWHNTILPAQDDQPLLLMTGINITERKKAENQLRHTLEELERLHHLQSEEIRIAASLQQAMLPSPEITLPGIVGHAIMQTSSTVGGDYYDYYAVNGRYSVILLGDVTGHGVGAGSLVSAVKASVSQLRGQGAHRPAEILAAINDIVSEVGHQALFMTMACLVLDAREGKLQLACAGHASPYHLSPTGQLQAIESFAQPLGQKKNHNYLNAEIETEWELGGRIVLFTDGIVEEESPTGEMYGYERLERLIKTPDQASAEELCQQLLESLLHHTHSPRFEDDITMLVLDHHERVSGTDNSSSEHLHLLPLSRFRRGDHPDPEIDRRWLVLRTEGPFKEFLPIIARDDIRRVLPTDHGLYREIPIDSFLTQHVDSDDELTQLMGSSHWRQSYLLTHTDDKAFILEEIEALLRDRGCSEECAQQIGIVADEMLENAFYAAPRDGRYRPLYEKGTSRPLQDERVLLEVAQSGNTWGLMTTDDWGTLTSERFLGNLSQASQQGVISGVGGAGLYMMWELSHYLQIRVKPHLKTQLVALWDMDSWTPVSEDSGFQYFEQ